MRWEWVYIFIQARITANVFSKPWNKSSYYSMARLNVPNKIHGNEMNETWMNETWSPKFDMNKNQGNPDKAY